MHEFLAGRDAGVPVVHAIGVALVGSLLSLFWGWTSKVVVLAVLLLWSVAAGLYERFHGSTSA